MAILAALQRYVRTHFTNPQRGTSRSDNNGDNLVQDANKPSSKVCALVIDVLVIRNACKIFKVCAHYWDVRDQHLQELLSSLRVQGNIPRN